MLLSVRGSTKPTETMLESIIERQLPFAAALALNDTAQEVVRAEQREMATVFDRPTPYTLNAFFVRRASKNNLVAVVERKAQPGGHHYLEVEEAGGVRGSKAIETLLGLRLPTTKNVRAIIPADGAQLDQYGNWSSGEISKIMADFQANRDRYQNRTAASWQKKQARAQAKGKAVPKYFIPQSGLTQDIYMRDGKKIRIIAHLLEALPSYRPLFDFYGIADGTASVVFEAYLMGHLQEAIATAK